MLDKLHGRLLLRHGRTARNGRYKDYEPKHKILGSVLGHLWFRDYNFRALFLLYPSHKDSTSVFTEQAVLSGTVVKFRSKSSSTACTVVALKVDM